MPGDAAGRISVAHAISQYDPSEVVSARKHRGKITALVSVGRNRNHVAFQSSQFQRTVSALVTGPQFHTAERALVRRCTCELLAFDFLESHSSFDAEEPNPVTGRASLALFRPALGQLAMRGTVTPGATEAYKDRFSSYFGRAAPGTGRARGQRSLAPVSRSSNSVTRTGSSVSRFPRSMTAIRYIVSAVGCRMIGLSSHPVAS